MRKKSITGSVHRKTLLIVGIVLVVILAGLYFWMQRTEVFEPSVISDEARERVLVEISKETPATLSDAERQQVLDAIQR